MKIRIYTTEYGYIIKVISKDGKEYPLSDYFILKEGGYIELPICK